MPHVPSKPSCVRVLIPNRGLKVSAQRIIMSRRRGGALSIHFVANWRIE